MIIAVSPSSELSAAPRGPLGPQLSKFIRRHATTESALVAILQPILHLDSNYLNIWALKLNSCCPE